MKPNIKLSMVLPSSSAFWSKVRKTKTCWLWTARTHKGYGVIATKIGKKKANRQAHRVSWEMHYGSAGGKLVLHRCDVRNCVRPTHLFLGTQADNINDMFKKNRQNKVAGCAHWNATIDETVVKKIRADVLSGDSLGVVASRYQLSRSSVCLIANRKRWKSIP